MKQRKTRVEKDDSVPPLRQLKQQPDEIIDWAYGLRDQFPIATIREKIKERTGIYMAEDASYSRFCLWYQQWEEFVKTGDAMDEIKDFWGQFKPGRNFEDIRRSASVVLLTRALYEGKN